MSLMEYRKLFIGTDEEFSELIGKFNGHHLNGKILKNFEKQVIQPMKKLKYGMICVDVQNDFISGSLSIANGPARQNPEEVIPQINRLTENEQWSVVIYSRDVHPWNHISFYEHAFDDDRQIQEYDRNSVCPFAEVQFTIPETKQVLYPAHCIIDSFGADLHSDLKVPQNARIVLKGTHTFKECYSAFGEEDEPSETEEILRQAGVDAVMCMGLAYDICVSHTTESAAARGFFASLVVDASKGLSEEGIVETDEKLKKLGVALLTTTEALEVLEGKKFPLAWALRLLS